MTITHCRANDNGQETRRTKNQTKQQAVLTTKTMSILFWKILMKRSKLRTTKS